MNNKYNFITLGYDCSPAAALKACDLRIIALPFDWVVSNLDALHRCFTDDFKFFHKNLKFNYNKTRLIDEYGFEFPHDYPLNNIEINENIIGEGSFDGKDCIIDNWKDYYDIVLDKYNRRIERFKNMLSSEIPVIILCRYSHNDAIYLKQMISKFFNKNNVYFINSNGNTYNDTNNNITSVYTEQNNIWNETDIWKQEINKVIKLFE